MPCQLCTVCLGRLCSPAPPAPRGILGGTGGFCADPSWVGEGAGGEKGKLSLRANPEPLLCCTAGAWLLKGFGTTALLQRWAGGGAGAELHAGQNWPLHGSSGHVPAVPAAGTGQGLQREAGVTGLLPFGASSQSYWNLNLKWVSGVSVQSFICFQSRFSEHELEFCQEFLKCF